jgi:hypothetical protein
MFIERRSRNQQEYTFSSGFPVSYIYSDSFAVDKYGSTIKYPAVQIFHLAIIFSILAKSLIYTAEFLRVGNESLVVNPLNLRRHSEKFKEITINLPDNKQSKPTEQYEIRNEIYLQN